MVGTIAITDEGWYDFLEKRPKLTEQEGPHEIRNGLLLRADLHRLFDTGYITVTPELRLEVGARLRKDYSNGRSYYPLHGAWLDVPSGALQRPERGFLEWHNEHVFRG